MTRPFSEPIKQRILAEWLARLRTWGHGANRSDADRLAVLMGGSGTLPDNHRGKFGVAAKELRVALSSPGSADIDALHGWIERYVLIAGPASLMDLGSRARALERIRDGLRREGKAAVGQHSARVEMSIGVWDRLAQIQKVLGLGTRAQTLEHIVNAYGFSANANESARRKRVGSAELTPGKPSRQGNLSLIPD